MKKNNTILILALTAMLSLAAGGTVWADQVSSTLDGSEAEYIVRDDWAPDVKQALNRFIAVNGKASSSYDESTYVVFDFDNTTAIFDIEEQLAIYQLQHMAFAMTPEELPEVLSTELSDSDQKLTDSEFPDTTYAGWITDISAAYTELYADYGPFTAEGLSEEESAEIQKDDEWREFAAKMRLLYDVVYDCESADVAYPWITYWFTGMSSEEVYHLAYASHSFYSQVETTEETWISPESLVSCVGPVTCTWTSGIQVTANLQELMRAFNENGIHVWICSASDIDVVRAAVDFWDLHNSVTGVLAMTGQYADGVRTNAYDYENGCGFLTAENGWKEDTIATGTQTQGAGKVTAIQNVLCEKYGHGPAAGFMDSTGDFNFCTEFRTLQLVVCFNRANRKVTDGGGLIAELAVYQKEDLHYDLESARAAGDTLYVLQGRDENGLRTLRAGNCTLRLGSTEEQLFANEDNSAELEYMRAHSMSTEEILNGFCLKTAADDADNLLGTTSYGFLTEYPGYHSLD